VYQFWVTGAHLKVTEVEDAAMGSSKVGGSGGSVKIYTDILRQNINTYLHIILFSRILNLCKFAWSP
jgi:hypothetical protein